MTDPGETATSDDEDAIDASWWMQVYESAGSDATYDPPEQLGSHFLVAAQQACDEQGADSMQARVLTVLARAVSPMLQPEDWNEPFRPMWQMPDGRRSHLPKDMEPDELAVLARIAPILTPAPLRARAADIAWTYGGRRDHALLVIALDA